MFRPIFRRYDNRITPNFNIIIPISQSQMLLHFYTMNTVPNFWNVFLLEILREGDISLVDSMLDRFFNLTKKSFIMFPSNEIRKTKSHQNSKIELNY